MKTLSLLLYMLVTSTAPLIAKDPGVATTSQARVEARQATDDLQAAVDRARASGRFDLRVLIGYMDIAEKDLVERETRL
jgi:hypothetical protein